MKFPFLLAGAALLLSAPAFAQSSTKTTTMTDPATGAKVQTEVKVRENGTTKVEYEAQDGRTKTGEAIHEAGQDTKEAGQKVAHGTKVGAKKVAHGTKKAGKAVKKTAKKTADKVENAVD